MSAWSLRDIQFVRQKLWLSQTLNKENNIINVEKNIPLEGVAKFQKKEIYHKNLSLENQVLMLKKSSHTIL